MISISQIVVTLHRQTSLSVHKWKVMEDDAISKYICKDFKFACGTADVLSAFRDFFY